MSKPIIPVLALSGALLMAGSLEARAEGCLFEPQGEGRVAEIIDGRSFFRLTDGREIRLAGIESVDDETTRANRAAALSALIAGRDVSLLSPDDTPDRYGRQTAIVFLGSTETPVQALLLRQGDALVSAEIADRDCAAELGQAEAEARHAKKGVWADPSVIKNAESSGDILSAVGQFAIVEGKILSVRQAGTTTFLNFGRSWTRGFAATISRQTMPALESAGIAVKSLENRWIASGASLRRTPDRGLAWFGSGRLKYCMAIRLGWRHT